MKLYLVRHLPTPWNLEERLQGTRDISIAPPTNELLTVIENNSKLIAGVEWERMLVSEKIRTQETARHFGFSEFIVEPLLNELNFGKFEGRQKTDLLEELGPAWFDDVLQLELGETLQAFQSRLEAFIDAYRENQTVIAFTHGAVIRGLKSLHSDGKISKMNHHKVPNAGVEFLEF